MVMALPLAPRAAAIDGGARVLHAVAVHGLDEVALAIEQAHGDEVERHVARGLAVVAGEDAEPAGIVRETLVEAVLGAEIGNQVAGSEAFGRRIRPRLPEVGIEAAEHLVVVVEVRGRYRRRVERRLIDAPQEQSRIAADARPQAGIERLKEFAGGPVPAESQVRRELAQALEGGRQCRVDFERELLATHGLRRFLDPDDRAV
jgi:hypothetical protein